MRNLIFLILLLAVSSHAAYTEFYCQTTGSNLNAGSTTADAALVTETGGDWVAGTGVFTKAGANLSAITVGMFASVYIDGATVGVFVGRITAVDDTADTVTVSLTTKSGTAPVDGTANRTIKVGGAWKGPNAAESFPFNFVQNTMLNASGHVPRVNIKSGTTYSITAAMTHANAGPMVWQGYTTTAGDGGRCVIDGGTSGASYVLLTYSAVDGAIADCMFQNNGATGSASGMTFSGSRSSIRRCVFNSVRGVGLDVTAVVIVVECEAYACNQSNTAAFGGIRSNQTGTLIRRCVSHDNAGSNGHGFVVTGSANLDSCISDSNGGEGAYSNGSMFHAVNSDFYNNAGDGVDILSATATHVYIENCSFVNNGGFGVNSSAAPTLRNGAIVNCGFGSGTEENTGGTVLSTLQGVNVFGSVTYSANVTPWIDPANGDFRINLAAAVGAGRGLFTQTAPSYTGTVAFPDIGAGQTTNNVTVIQSTGGNYTFAQ